MTPTPSTVVLANEPLVRWDWVVGHLDDIGRLTIEHLQLSLAAVGIGFAIACVLAIVALRLPWTYPPITWATGLLYTIPSAALFTFLIPYTGLGFRTALIGLVSYTLLILVRNIVAGIRAVPPATLEAADAMGYTPWRRLVAVEVPVALPAIITGLRIASVTTIGLVTVGALVGAGGYGQLMLDGLRRFFPTPTVVGAVLSMLMAAVIDLAFVGVGRALTPWTRRAGGA
jgi:osmoprotectant transport system permease protein